MTAECRDDNSLDLLNQPLPSEPTLSALDISTRTTDERQYWTDENPRISILELMAITGMISAGIAAISQLGMIGTLILFFLCATFSGIVRAQLVEPARLRFWNQLLWGVLMPIGCAFGDPFIFGQFVNGRALEFSRIAIPVYTFMIWQIQLLASSWFITPKHRRMNGFLGGTFLAGAAFALLLAICMVPITIIGLLALVGVLGLTPWLTAYVYYQSGLMHLRRSRNSAGRLPWFFVVSGFSVSVGLLVTLLILAGTGLLESNFLLRNNQFDF